jgi:hypothetical protein
MSFLQGKGFVQSGGVSGDGTGITDPEAFRKELEAQSTSIGFHDRFDRSDRYSEGATITNLASTPEVGDWAYRVRQGGATTPTVTAGALECGGDTLYYLLNRAPTPNGVFSMGAIIEMERTSVYATAINNGGWNISIGSVPLIDDSGSIHPIDTEAPIHLNFSIAGITSATLYPSTNLTCLNRTYVGGVYPWDELDRQQLPKNAKIAITIRVVGDIVEVTAVGLGTILLTHPNVSAKIGSEYTYFWWEPNGPLLGSDYRQIARLYEWWAMAEELDQLAAKTNRMSISGGPHRFPGQMRLFPEGRTAKQAADTLPGESTAQFISSTPSTVARGPRFRASGGAAIFEGPVIHNYGFVDVGGTDGGRVVGFMVGAVDMALDAPLSSSAGAETNLLNNRFTPVFGLENSDWERWFFAGELIGASAKRIRLNLAFGGGDPGTPGNIIDSNVSGTPLDALTGFWELEVHRYTNSTASHVFYAKLWANGVLIAAKRTAWNGTTNYVAGSLKTTTVSAGGVTCDTFTHEIARVNVT